MSIRYKNALRFNFILCLFLVTVVLRGQSFTISGTVKDSSGEPVIGAVIMLDGNSAVVTTADINGKWSLSLPNSAIKGASLTVSSLGFTKKTISVGKSSIMDIILEENSEMLEETVVVGYGSMRRSDITGAVTSVKINDDDAAKSGSLDQLLMGNAAGVDVIQSSESPDAGVSIRIRGVTSLNGSSEPLYVIDGVILTDANASSSGMGKVDASEDVNSLMGLNPNDIASIEILKDASATAIYGSSGANGVVLITTKTAQKDKPVIQFNVGYDISTPYKTVDVLSFDGFVDYLKYREAADDGGWGLSTLKTIYSNYGTETQKLAVTPVNWQKEYIDNALKQRYFLSVAGRPKDMPYKLSLGYNRGKGVVANTGSETFTARLNADKTFKKFSLGVKANFSYVKSTGMQGAGSGDNGTSTSFMKSLTNYRPFMKIGEDDEEYEGEGSVSSPLKWVKDSYQTRDEMRVTPSIYAQYKVLPWLRIKSSFGADYRWQERVKYKGPSISQSPASGVSTQNEIYSWNWDNLVMMNHKFNQHSLSGTIGFTMNSVHNSAHTLSTKNIMQYGTGFSGIASGDPIEYSYESYERSLISTFVRGIYNYSDRYILTATYRVDGSSLFAKGNRFSGFPSAAFAWRINKEPWFRVKSISTAKLRLGWGQVGNCSVSPYQVMTTYGAGHIGNHFTDAGYKPAISFSAFSNDVCSN